MSELATLYLTIDEIDVLAIHLATALDGTSEPTDAHHAARIIWHHVLTHGLGAHDELGSLATMLSEARTGLERSERDD